MPRGILPFLLFSLVSSAIAQEDLLKSLSDSQENEKEFLFQTFKGTRVVNGQSVEAKGKGELEFIIGHRFGRINSGPRDFFGWDDAYIRFGLEYGVTSKLGVSLGRSSDKKMYDGYLRYQVVRQSKGGGSPFTITALTGMGIETRVEDWPFKSKLFYSSQALVARKFSSKLALQLSTVYVHANRTDQWREANNQLAVGLAGRFKFTKSVAVNAEYFHRTKEADPPPITSVPVIPYNNSIGIGIDIETGGHVFQLIFSNTQGMTERAFINQTEGDFFEGDIHFGFNITRTFQLAKGK
jgi:Membrane bound beta barrel domain (DUF5777)